MSNARDTYNAIIIDHQVKTLMMLLRNSSTAAINAAYESLRAFAESLPQDGQQLAAAGVVPLLSEANRQAAHREQYAAWQAAQQAAQQTTTQVPPQETLAPLPSSVPADHAPAETLNGHNPTTIVPTALLQISCLSRENLIPCKVPWQRPDAGS